MLADCGPIKRIDLIKTMDKETKVKQSRGFGFVTFALEEDAAKAVQTINGKRYACVRSCETLIPVVVTSVSDTCTCSPLSPLPQLSPQHTPHESICHFKIWRRLEVML